MRIQEIKVYKFNELSEQAKDRAVERLCDININFDWWDAVYYDADMIGLKITSFDTYRKDITGELTDDIENVIKEIEDNHGEACETYKLAQEYKLKLAEINETMLDDDMPDAVDELTGEFEHDLLQEYLSILEKEYDYLTDFEAITETIEANDYEFTEDGKLI